MSQFHIKIFINLCILLLLNSGGLFAQKINTPIYDLKSVDFNSGVKIQLDTVWSFYWNELLTPSDSHYAKNSIDLNQGITSWTEQVIDTQSFPSYGYATYTTKIILPTIRPVMAVHIPKINASAKIWINDEIVFIAGVVGIDAEHTTHRRKSVILPISNLNDTISIVVQVSNFYHRLGGMTKPITIGKIYDFWKSDREKIMSEMILIGSLMFIGLSFLILYYSYWKLDKAILYFSVFCLCWGYRNLSEGYAPLPYLFDDFPWFLHVKIEYFSLFFGALMGILFLNVVFKDHFHFLFPRLTTWLVWIFILLNFLLPSLYINYLLPPFFISVSICMIYAIIKILQISDEKNQSTLALVGIFSGIMVVSFHMYTYNFLEESNSIIISIGYIFVFFVNSLLLGYRFSTSFRTLNLLQKQTYKQNQEIAIQAQLLNETNDRLEEKVVERTQEIGKVIKDLKERNINLEQFNYIISHNMRAPVSNISGLLSLYNHDDTSDRFNIKILDKLGMSCTQLDTVLKDLTNILEVKHQIKTFQEKVIFETLIKKIQKAIINEIETAEVEFVIDFEVKSIKSIGSYWYSIFYNLISNAIKYKKSDVACVIKITTKKDGKNTIIIFQDNGLGINLEKNKGQIFGLYKRFHSHVEGKGMGLFMVKTQVESIGGTIHLDSKPNQGCKFTLKL